MSVIRIEHLTRDYGGGKGVFDLTMDVGEGEVFGFLGPQRRGKDHHHPSPDGLHQGQQRQLHHCRARLLA